MSAGPRHQVKRLPQSTLCTLAARELHRSRRNHALATAGRPPHATPERAGSRISNNGVPLLQAPVVRNTIASACPNRAVHLTRHVELTTGSSRSSLCWLSKQMLPAPAPSRKGCQIGVLGDSDPSLPRAVVGTSVGGFHPAAPRCPRRALPEPVASQRFPIPIGSSAR